MDNLFLIAGLGNPGQEYAETRHNVGFATVDRLAKRWEFPWIMEKRFQSRCAWGQVEGRKLVLCQPQTFMNKSGDALGALTAYYQITQSKVLVVVDDADLTVGTLRLRPSGSSAGHRGLESIEAHWGREYARLRIGIGRAPGQNRPLRDYVLEEFSRADKETINVVLEKAADQAACWLIEGIAPAMNKFNTRATQQKKDTE